MKIKFNVQFLLFMTVYLVDGQDIITYIILYHVTATKRRTTST